MKPSRRGQGSVYARAGTSSLWVCYYVNGKRHREPAMVQEAGRAPRPATTEPEAQRFLKERLKEVHAGTFVGTSEEKVTVSELLDDLVVHLRTKGAKAVGSLISHLKPIREVFGLDRAVDVTTAKVERYQQERLAAGKARATLNRETGALRQAFNLAAKRKPPKISRHVVPYIPMLTEDNAREGFVEPATFARIVSSLPALVADIARFAYGSGWRRGEILPLRWEAVDRQAREVRLRTSKSGSPRTLPLTGLLWDLIERRWKARQFEKEDKTTGLSEYVFHAGDGRAVVDFKRSWATACEAAGSPGLLFHDLRRSAVRDMIRAGVPQSVAMRISGHKTTAVFIRYDITSEDDKRAALERTQEHREARPRSPEESAPNALGNAELQARGARLGTPS